MRVLVTGATGFVGRHVVSVLEDGDFDYVTMGRNDSSKNGNHVAADLLTVQDYSGVINRVKPTHLIHLAWYAEHGKYWSSPLNIDWMSATHRLLDHFYKHGGQHALIAGTCAEYDWRHGYCVEDLTPTNSNTLYGAAKDSSRRFSELLSKQYGTLLAWARIFFPYGTGEADARLVPSLFEVFRQKKEPFGVNAKSYRDLLHVSDLAQALVICSSRNFNGAINVCSGEAVSIEVVVREIANLCNQDAEQILKLQSDRHGDPKFLLGDNRKLLALGWKQKVSLHDGLFNY